MDSVVHTENLKHRGWTGLQWHTVPSKHSEARRMDWTTLA